MASYSQPVLIFNPAAGKLRSNPEAILQRTKAALARGGLVPRLIPTTGPNQGGDLARQAVAEGSELVLVLGGDGTINEVVQGVACSGVPMGVLPGGTANVLAMELGLGSKLERAAERLVSCKPVEIALGRITSAAESRYFLMMCGAGLDAQIVSEVSGSLKARTGKFAYWVAGSRQFVRTVPPVRITVDGQDLTGGFVLISRVRNYGGDLEIASGASLLRDEFEVVLFEGSSPLRYAWYMLGVGFKRVQHMRGVWTLGTRVVEIHTATPTQIDGEFFDREPVKIEIVDRAFKLLMPATYG